ncbi:PAS domain-containing protein [Solimonas marina]|uniref:EAL domain-containing protein n=1 Tax=Solimonas marina TaxID=2714601 RepID=A0A970B304_9GAMM|nr:PAS domain-containing protein [Solimonas marina]NKF20707.1 EAL domain-containing protein [Solimonas marina]
MNSALTPAGPHATPWSKALEEAEAQLWEWDFGDGSQDLARGSDWPLLHPDDRDGMQQALAAHLRGETPSFRHEHRIRCSDGHYRWISVRGHVVERGAGGHPRRMVGSATDIHDFRMALDDGARRFRLMFDAAPIGMTVQSLQRRLLDVNRALCEMLGYDADTLLRQHSYDITHPDDRADDEATREALMSGSSPTVRQHKRYIARDGSALPVQVDVSLLRDENGAPQYFITQVQDVRERRRYEEALHAEKELAQVTLASITDGVLRTDRDGRISFCNIAALRLLGHEQLDAVTGQPFTDVVTFFTERGSQELADPIGRVLAGEQDADTVMPPMLLQNQHGEGVPVEISLGPLRARDGSLLGCVCVLHDLSHMRLLSDQLIHQASHDALTDLPNRRELEAELVHWLSTARLGVSRHTLLYLDLDHFKLINETAGHSTGDRVVREIADRLRTTVPEKAVLARTGGDEFAILLPHSTPADALDLGESLVRTIGAMRFEYEGRSYALSASVGIGVIDADTSDANTVLAEADTACYIAKRHGGGRCQSYSARDAAVRQAFVEGNWASRIQQALENGDVLLYGQRIISAEDAALPNYEVLIRIRDSDGFIHRPMAFLTAAERFGLSGRVDRWVVEHSLATLARHLDRSGQPQFGYTAINLTAHSASDPAFADFLFDALERYRFPPSRLRFEITEGMALRSFGTARRLVSRLRQIGCRVMLDDFGSGFTSFDYLREMKVDGLKIDMSYTRELSADALNRTIVESIIRIGKALGLEIVAEGVETQATREILVALGSDYLQGHLFHVAEPISQLLQLDD